MIELPDPDKKKQPLEDKITEIVMSVAIVIFGLFMLFLVGMLLWTFVIAGITVWAWTLGSFVVIGWLSLKVKPFVKHMLEASEEEES